MTKPEYKWHEFDDINVNKRAECPESERHLVIFGFNASLASGYAYCISFVLSGDDKDRFLGDQNIGIFVYRERFNVPTNEFKELIRFNKMEVERTINYIFLHEVEVFLKMYLDMYRKIHELRPKGPYSFKFDNPKFLGPTQGYHEEI